MVSGADSIIKINRKMIKVAEGEAEGGNYLGAILTLKDVQKDLEKWMFVSNDRH